LERGHLAVGDRPDHHRVARERDRIAEGVSVLCVGGEQLGLLGPNAARAEESVGRTDIDAVRIVLAVGTVVAGHPDRHRVAHERD